MIRTFVIDPLPDAVMEIKTYPVALYEGQTIVRGGLKVATVLEACVFHCEAHLIAYIEAQNRP